VLSVACVLVGCGVAGVRSVCLVRVVLLLRYVLFARTRPRVMVVRMRSVLGMWVIHAGAL
jgi:hypothetical protein